MDPNIENGIIINQKIPEVLEYSDQYKKEMRKLLRLNNIFSEFENKASKDLNFFIEESNRRYSKSKCGINLKGLISSTRKKCLDESKKILNDNFYNNKVIGFEKEKMKHKGNVILYKKLRNSMNIVKNPDIIRKRLITENNINVSREDFLLNMNNNRNGENHKYNYNYSKKNAIESEIIINKIINEEQKSLSKSIDNYKSNLDQLNYILDKKPIINRRKNSIVFRKINLNLPNLKFINYTTKKPAPKNKDIDDPAKKADIHKLLPFSRLSKKNEDILLSPQTPSKKQSKKSIVLPYITEPNLPKKKSYTNKKQYYKDYHDTIAVVADSANKELFVNNNFDKKRAEVENILLVDDIPKVQLYDDLAHQKANNIKEERRRKNNIISKNQNYLKLTEQQKVNLEIETNLNLIKNIEDNLYSKEKDKKKNNKS